MIITYYLLITIMIGLCISLAISIIQPTKTGMMIIGVVCSLVIATILINDNVKADDCVELVRVVDGDTMYFKKDNTIMNVRVLGIDTFETKDNKQAKKQSRKFGISKEEVIKRGEAAKQFAINTFKSIKCITLESDHLDKDKYGRFLRYVLVDNVDYSVIMLQNGLAHPYCYDNKIKMFEYYHVNALYGKCK